MNELLFLAHIGVVTLANIIALRMGKEALVGLACTQIILANLFITKQIQLFGFYTTSTDAFMVGNIISINLLQEYFDKKIAYKTTWIEFFIMIFFTITAQFHLSYLPTAADTMQAHFALILQYSIRIVCASFIAFLMSMNVEISLYQFLRWFLPRDATILRNYTAMIASQILDTVLFGFLGLYGIVQSLGDLIIISIIFKILATFIAVPLVFYAVKFIGNQPSTTCSL
jgi:uncharacterized integral membrane protein (TIGR00697 family)